MKKNLILFGVLVALLIGTYMFQEVRTNKNFEESLVKDHLVRVEEMRSLKWNDINAVKKDGQWWDGDKLLSQNLFKQIEKRISQVKKIKSIKADAKSSFGASLEVTVNGHKWTVGELTLDKMGFYLIRDQEVMVAVMEGESQELSQDPSNTVATKREELIKALNYNLSQLRETQLFRFYPHLPSDKVLVEADGRPSFELDLLTDKTIPAPIKGIEVHQHLQEKFKSLITQMTIKEQVEYSETLKKSKLGQIIFLNAKNKVVWELWLKSDKSADAYVLDSQSKLAWRMTGGTLKTFFIQVQDYWDKKVIPPAKFADFTSLKTTFIQGSKSAVVEIQNHEPFTFKTDKYKVDDVKMNILLLYVFNLSEKDQADRVSQLSSSERKTILSGNYLRLEIYGEDLLFWRKEQELIVVNLTQGYKAHFHLTDESFRATFEDVLK